MFEILKYVVGNEQQLTPRNIDGLINGTYLVAAIAIILMLLIAAFFSKRIYSKLDGTHIRKRKRVFWSMAIVFPMIYTMYCFFLVSNRIESIMYLNKFQKNATIAIVLSLVLYVLAGIIISHFNRSKKLGDWFFANHIVK